MTLFDVPFYVEPSFLFIIAFVFYSAYTTGGSMLGAALYGFVIFFSILFHEMGHAFTARGLGQREVSVSLHMLGGSAFSSETTTGRRLLVVLMGPFCTFLIFAFSWLLLNYAPVPNGSGIELFLQNAFFLNLILLVINMLPIYPMDGGQALFYLMNFKISYMRALRLIAQISIGVMVLAGLFFFKVGMNPGPFFLMFMIGCLLTNIEILNQTK